MNKILVGNKCDITEEKSVSTEEGARLAEEYGIGFFEASAKNDINVEQVRTWLSYAVANGLHLNLHGRLNLTRNRFRRVSSASHAQSKTASSKTEEEPPTKEPSKPPTPKSKAREDAVNQLNQLRVRSRGKANRGEGGGREKGLI